MENNYTVYMHVCPNGKKYVGITKLKVNERWANGKGYKSCPSFYNAIQKYKWENIEHIILYKNLSREKAEKKEILLIKKYKTNKNEFGYNIENGGHVNCVNEITKNKISKTMKEREVYKKNPHCYKKGNVPWMAGKKHTEETKRKIKEKRAKQKMNSNKILCIETNEIFNSAKDVEKKYGFNAISIRRVCSGERKKAYNFSWKYMEPKNRKNKKYY